jgi:hypothetical protein
VRLQKSEQVIRLHHSPRPLAAGRARAWKAVCHLRQELQLSLGQAVALRREVRLALPRRVPWQSLPPPACGPIPAWKADAPRWPPQRPVG